MYCYDCMVLDIWNLCFLWIFNFMNFNEFMNVVGLLLDFEIFKFILGFF